MRYQGLSDQGKSKSGYFRLSLFISANVMVLILFLVYHRSLLPTDAAGPPSCLTVSASGPIWQNLAFVASQSGTFAAEIDGTPFGNNIDAGIGLSNGSQTGFTGLACIARFNTGGTIDARNGGAYAAASTIPYSANTTY